MYKFKLLNPRLLFCLIQFLPDANDVMQLLLKTQTEMEELEADDPQVGMLENGELPYRFESVAGHRESYYITESQQGRKIRKLY